jgi:ribosome biogenesis protein BMS1
VLWLRDDNMPTLRAALLASEHNIGLMQVRIMKHRWAKKILKTNDPLIFSVGCDKHTRTPQHCIPYTRRRWRRFQSLPVYGIQDQLERVRCVER